MSAQLSPPLNVPLSVKKLTHPVGVVAPAPAVSVTVAVQVVAPFTAIVFGVQLTLALVDRKVAVMLVLPLLVAWALSPKYLAVIERGPAAVAV